MPLDFWSPNTACYTASSVHCFAWNVTSAVTSTEIIQSPILKNLSYLGSGLVGCHHSGHALCHGARIHSCVCGKRVLLTDILLMFIYLEVLAMVQQFVMNGKIPVRYPIYIAMMAIARYITLGMKELDATLVVWLSVAAFVLAAATLLIRVGHHYWPYVDNHTAEKDE